MVLEFFSYNFMSLIIISALIVLMYANRETEIPAAKFFGAAVMLMIVVMVTDHIERLSGNITVQQAGDEINFYIRVRLICSVILYIIRPVIILLELYLLTPEKENKFILAVPAIVNAMIYVSAFITPKYSFGFSDENTFQRGLLGHMVYVVMLLYLLMLLVFSVEHFKKSARRSRVIVIFMVIIAVIEAALEWTGVIIGYSTPVTALMMLIYYTYLSVIHQYETARELAQKELTLAKDNLLILKSQIQPHFVFNSLSIIRSLTKRDKQKAVQCIDDFSDYLKAHIGAILQEDLIPFEKELENVKAYLSLVQADYSGKVEVIYELEETDFRMPSLSLEPIVENAVKYGIGREGGRLTIATRSDDDNYVLTITDSGNKEKYLKEEHKNSTGIGLENTRKRLDMQLGASLDINIQESGTVVTILIPKEREKK